MFLLVKESFVIDQKLILNLILPNMKLFASIEYKDKPNGIPRILETL
jgi:hypothetical protein